MPHPPRLATLLLNWLAPGNEALRGDLDEEFRNGRGSRWYWRQVASLLAHEGTLRIRGRAVAGVENFVTGFITLTLLGFYAVFVVNVTDWLLRFEGVQVLLRFPNAFGPFNGVAPILALALGAVTGRVIGARHQSHRLAAIVVFGGVTMLCAAAALKAATMASEPALFLPDVMPQVATTAMFVLGLVGGITTLGIRPPIVLLGSLAKP
jgi:hypothetical protein